MLPEKHKKYYRQNQEGQQKQSKEMLWVVDEYEWALHQNRQYMKVMR